MFQTIVNVKIPPKNKDMARMLRPLGIWALLWAVSFFLSVKVTYYALPFMIVIFLCVIPVAWHTLKRAGGIHKNSFVNQTIAFHVMGMELYMGHMKLIAIKDENGIYLESADKEGLVGTSFSGTVEEPYVQEFVAFLNNNHVKIQVEDWQEDGVKIDG